MPAFGTGNVIHMFDDMKDICDQLVKKWERYACFGSVSLSANVIACDL